MTFERGTRDFDEGKPRSVRHADLGKWKGRKF